MQPIRHDLSPTPVLKPPSECSGAELAEFETAIRSAGEPASPALSERIRRARMLALMRDEDGALTACGALRSPKQEHCAAVFRKAGVPSSSDQFTLDLGWLAGPGQQLKAVVRALAELTGGLPLFIITSNSETSLHEALKEEGFRTEGAPYPSVRGDYSNIIYLRTP